MMEVWCNESIKRLITSADRHFDDGLTVKERWDDLPFQFLIDEEGADTWLDRLPGEQDGILKSMKQTFCVPFGFLVKAPKGFDPGKSKSVLVTVPFSQRESIERQFLDLIQSEFDFSDAYNSLGESILLGRAVYSWVRQNHGNCKLERETESHLPEGTYTVILVFGLIHQTSTHCLGKVGYTSEADATIPENMQLRIDLSLVSKKTNSKSSKTKKVEEDDREKSEEYESREYGE